MRKLYQIFFLLVCLNLTGNAQELPDTLIRREFNVIQFPNRNVLSKAAQAWKSASKEQFVVLHLGDSHLQNENLPNKARTLIQGLLGNGGIGLIQPFSIVKSYDASFYKSTHTGNWEYAKSYQLPPKLPLGVRGMTAKTLDSLASFTLKFSSIVSESNKQLTLFVDNSVSSFVPSILTDSVPAQLISAKPGVMVFGIDKPFKNLTLTLAKTSPEQNQFMMSGMSLLNSQRGAVWHNAGVGASQYKSVLYEQQFSEQAKYLDPDLVIIDFGTNDFLYANQVPPNLESEILRVIEKVRLACPEASIIVTSAQDMSYKGRHVSAGQDFALLMKQIAKETQCGFWDWYQVSGGPKSMTTWLSQSYAVKDGIHLNAKGSAFKASMLVEALGNTIKRLDTDPQLTELILENPSLPVVIDQPVNEVSKKEKSAPKSAPTKNIEVKKGQTLSQIAEKYHISIRQLKKLNHLNSDKIKIGQELRIK